METENKKYESGDVVIGQSIYHGFSKHTVVRVTKTQAILSNGSRLKIDNLKSSRAIGASGYGCTYYQINNDYLENEYKKAIQINRIKRILSKLKLEEIDTQELDDLYNTVDLLAKKYLIKE